MWACPNGCRAPSPATWAPPLGAKAPPCGNCDAPLSRTPTHIRTTHPAGFRSGKWARILTSVESRGRDCWLVQFDDGQEDWWVKNDPMGGYEFEVRDA